MGSAAIRRINRDLYQPLTIDLFLLRQHNPRQRTTAAIGRQRVIGVDNPSTAIHWINCDTFEVAGEDRRLLALCADNIEFWAPDAPPVLGRTAVSAQLARGSTRIHGIEISGCRIFKRDCLLNGKLQDYVFFGGRLHS